MKHAMQLLKDCINCRGAGLGSKFAVTLIGSYPIYIVCAASNLEGGDWLCEK